MFQQPDSSTQARLNRDGLSGVVLNTNTPEGVGIEGEVSSKGIAEKAGRTNDAPNREGIQRRRNGPGIVIVGLPGSGKTTLARRIAGTFHLHHIELDEARWQHGWQKASAEAEVEFVKMHIANHLNGWVFCGDDAPATRVAMASASFILWLDYPARRTALRFVRRTWTRILTREVLWNGNRERIWFAIFRHPYEIYRNVRGATELRSRYAQELLTLLNTAVCPTFVFQEDAELEQWLAQWHADARDGHVHGPTYRFYYTWFIDLVQEHGGPPPPPDYPWWQD